MKKRLNMRKEGGEREIKNWGKRAEKEAKKEEEEKKSERCKEERKENALNLLETQFF